MQSTLKKDLRTSRQKRQDIILALLCCFAEQRINVVRLYSVNKVFGGFLKRYKDISSEEELGFYRDVVTRVYKELVGVFEDIMHLGFIRPRPSNGDVHFDICINPSMAQRLLSGIPETTIVKEIFPDFLVAYRIGQWNTDKKEDEDESDS